MSLYEIFRDERWQQLTQDPAGELWAESAETTDAFATRMAAAGYGVPDLLRVLAIIVKLHGDEILRLAEEIDALQQDS